jgi:hypothetical protein
LIGKFDARPEDSQTGIGRNLRAVEVDMPNQALHSGEEIDAEPSAELSDLSGSDCGTNAHQYACPLVFGPLSDLTQWIGSMMTITEHV